MSRNNFFRFWIILEINIICFILILILSDELFTIENCVKYFIIQAVSSTLLIFGFLINRFNALPLSYFIFSFALVLKIGAAPLHRWYINIVNSLEWIDLFILSSIQKFLPLLIIFMFINKYFIWRLVRLNVLIRLKIIYAEILIKKILACSSIYGLRWLFSALDLYLLSIFIIIYIINLIFFCSLIKNNNYLIIEENQISSNFYFLFFLFILFLRIGGIPPLIGFYPKFLIISSLLMKNILWLSLFLAQRAVILFFIYIKIFSKIITIRTKWIPWKKNFYTFNKRILIILLRVRLLFLLLHKDV